MISSKREREREEQTGKSLPVLIGILVLLVMSALATAPAMAQSLCTPDCEDDKWSPPDSAVAGLYNGCVVRIYYVKRTACAAPFYDVQITGIKFIGGPCSSLSLVDLMFNVEKAMFENNYANFPMPALGECINRFRVSRSSCWGYAETISGAINQYAPCGHDCCLIAWQVCNEGGVYRAYPLNTYPPQSNDCPRPTNGTCTFLCEEPTSPQPITEPTTEPATEPNYD